MKRRIRRFSLVALVPLFLMTMSAFETFAQTSPEGKKGFNATGYPIVSEPITITIVAQHDIGKQKKYSEMELFRN